MTGNCDLVSNRCIGSSWQGVLRALRSRRRPGRRIPDSLTTGQASPRTASGPQYMEPWIRILQLAQWRIHPLRSSQDLAPLREGPKA